MILALAEIAHLKMPALRVALQMTRTAPLGSMTLTR